MIELTIDQLHTAFMAAQRIRSLELSKKDAGSCEAYLCGNISITLPEEFVLQELDKEITKRKAELSALGIVLTR
jgi:hypothetical protein